MSSTFSAKAGLGGTLEGAQAHRLERCFSQMRWIVRSDRRIVLAIARPVQWVVSPGRFGAGQGQHPGHGGGGDRLARRPALVAQQTLHPGLGVAALPAPIAGRLTPARRATSMTGSRSAENKIIRHRCTCFSGRLRSLTTAAHGGAILASNDNADFLCHAPTIAHLACSILCLRQCTSRNALHEPHRYCR